MRLLVCVCLLTFSIASVHAQEAVVSHARFSRGASELEILGGVICSIDAGKPSKPTINFAQETVRFGLMLTAPRTIGWFPGNTELLLEAFGGEIYTDVGTAVLGANLVLRRNFLFRNSIFVPYAQAGGGGAWSDVARTEWQGILGSEWNFSLSFGLGVRVLLSDRCSLLLEHDAVHLSNAGSSDRNHGLNSLGGQIGLAYSF
jgi:hypothetical protein